MTLVILITLIGEKTLASKMQPHPKKLSILRQATLRKTKQPPVICKEAQILLFSACHLHKTCENETSLARLALTFAQSI